MQGYFRGPVKDRWALDPTAHSLLGARLKPDGLLDIQDCFVLIGKNIRKLSAPRLPAVPPPCPSNELEGRQMRRRSPKSARSLIQFGSRPFSTVFTVFGSC
jgi:hypothetical protein